MNKKRITIDSKFQVQVLKYQTGFMQANVAWKSCMIRMQKGRGRTFLDRRRNLKLKKKLERVHAQYFTIVFFPRARIVCIFIRMILTTFHLNISQATVMP